MLAVLLAFSLLGPQEYERAVVALVPGQGEQRLMRMYEVSDLIDASIADFEPPELGIGKLPRKPERAAPSAEPQAPSPESVRESRQRSTEALAALIRRHVEPALDPALDDALRCVDGTIVIAATLAQHEWVSAFLRTQRDFQGAIQTEARLFSVPENALQRLRVANGALLATLRERDDLCARLALEPDCETLNAPRILSFARQRANVSVIEQVAYVRDWEVAVVEPGAQEIADPVIDVINEGVVLDVRAMPMQDGKVLAELSVERCRLARPMRTAKVTIGKQHPTEVEVSLPEADKQRVASDVLLADAASVVLVPGVAGKQERRLVAVVTLRRSSLDGGAGK